MGLDVHLSMSIAKKKAFRESVLNAWHVIDNQNILRTLYIDKISTNEDHIYYYYNPENKKAFDFIINNKL